MSLRNEETPSKKERRRSTNRVQLEENVFTTQISHYHQTMGYYSGVGPPFIPDRNCYNNINWSSRAPPWTGWTPPPPGSWMTSVSNGGMVPPPQSFPCRVPNRVPPSPFNPPTMPPQPTPVIDPLLGTLHSPASSNLRGWYARYPNDIPIQEVPVVVPSAQLDNIECLRHVGNHLRADHNFVEKTLVQKCETTASVCGTTVTRRSWYKMPEKSPPQPTKEKSIKTSEKTDNVVETAVLPSKVKKMEDAVILSSDYYSNSSAKSSNCLPDVANHNTSSSNFTEYFLKRLMKKHQKESNMKKISVSDAMTSDTQTSNIQAPTEIPDKHSSHVPISKNHKSNSHTSKIGRQIIEDVIDLSRDSPPSSASEPNNNNVNCRQNEAASCDLVITNSYSLSFSGVPNKAATPSSLSGARLSPTKRKLSDSKPSTLEDNQKENLIVSESLNDFQMKLTDGRSKRKKYEPRKRDSFVLEEDTSCWVSGTMNKLIDSNYHSNDKHVLAPNIIEKTIASDQSTKYLNKIDSDNAPEYCDIVDILHSLSESGPNSQGVHASNKESLLSKKDSVLERKVIRTTHSIRNDKCITLDETDDSDGTQSGETLTPCTVIRSRQSLDTLSTADNSVDSLHDSTISSSSLDNNDVLEERIADKEITLSLDTDKNDSKDQGNRNSTRPENTSSVLKVNISLTKEKDEGKQLSAEIGSNKELTKPTWMTLSLTKPSVCKLPKAILPIKKQPIEHRISDEELETLESLGQKVSGENVAISSSCLKKELDKDYSPNKDGPQNDMIVMSETHTSVESEKTHTENVKPIKVWNSSENPIPIIDDRLENSEGAPSVGNESDDSLPTGHSLSKSLLLEGIGSYCKMAETDSKVTVPAAADASLIDQDAENFKIAKTKQIFDPALKVSSLADESGQKSPTATKANNLCDQTVDDDDHHRQSQCNAPNSEEMMMMMMPSQTVDNLQSQKQQEKKTVPQRQEIHSSFNNSILQVEHTKKSLLSRSSNIFTLTTSPLKSKTTTSLTNSEETDPAPTLQQPGLEILNLSKKVSSCNNLKEINQTPCLEISENGDMKVIAIVTDYEESTCDSLLGLAEPESVLGKNSNVIVTPINSSKKNNLLEYSEHTNSSPFKELHKSKMLAEIDKCKSAKENGSLFSSFLNCRKEKEVFSKNSNGDIVVSNDSTPNVKPHTHFSSHSVHSGGIEDQVVRLEAPNSTIGLNIMSVELKQPPSAVNYSTSKQVVPLVSSVVANCVNKSNHSTTINNHLFEKHEKSAKEEKKKKQKKSLKLKRKDKVKNSLKKFKRPKISQKKCHTKKMYQQYKKKYMSLGTKVDARELQDSIASCHEKDSELANEMSKDDKVTLELVSKAGPKTPLAEYDLNIIRARISSACPDRRGRIFRPPQQECGEIKDNTIDCVASLHKQCQTDSPFYGCVTHAFKGSCYKQTDRRISSPIIHKFVKFHGHKLLCVIINVKKYIIVRELVQKCFQGKNQIIFYRTKYRDYSFPYLELPFHMKSFALKYLLESGTLLTGNRATPLGIMLLSDAEIIYHFFYSFRECSLTACVQDWDPNDTGVYDHDWLKVLDTTPAVSMKMEPLDTATETGLPASYLCACSHTSNNFAMALGQCRTVARKPVKRPMSGIFEPSFESPVFGTTSSSTQTSPLDTISPLHPETHDIVSTKVIKRDNHDPTQESSSSTISLEESHVYSNSLMAPSDSDLVSVSSDYCDYVSKPISTDFVSEAHRNDDNDNNNNSSCGSDPLISSHFSSDLSLEAQTEDNKHETHFPLSDTAQTHEFVLGGMTLLDGKVVRFVELSGQRHFLLIDLDSSWTFSSILDQLLESEIVVRRCSASQRSFLLNLNRTLPQANADEMLLVADEFFPRLKTFLTLTPFDSSCHKTHMLHSKPDPEHLTPERQSHCPDESQSEQNYLFTEKQR